MWNFSVSSGFVEVAKLPEFSPQAVTTYVKKIYQNLAEHSRGEAVSETTTMHLLR